MNINIPTLDEIRLVIREEVARALREQADAKAPLLTVAQAAAELDVHPRTVRRRIKDGELPVVRVGKVIRIDRSALRPDPEKVAVLAREVLARVA